MKPFKSFITLENFVDDFQAKKSFNFLKHPPQITKCLMTAVKNKILSRSEAFSGRFSLLKNKWTTFKLKAVKFSGKSSLNHCNDSCQKKKGFKLV